MRKLQCKMLKDALGEMAIGETCIGPDGYDYNSVKVTCHRMKDAGMMFQTSIRTGVVTITRLK